MTSAISFPQEVAHTIAYTVALGLFQKTDMSYPTSEKDKVAVISM
jgi:hypothetical protein